VIASQAVRVAPVRHVRQPRPRHTARVTHRVRAGTTWEIRTFIVVSAVIAFVFVLAMLYLAQATTVSTRGYELQRLEQIRDELRRQNALLEVENARLDAPARIETEAQRLGLARVRSIPVVQLEPITAKQ
jgi:cell division protein FtsL